MGKMSDMQIGQQQSIGNAIEFIEELASIGGRFDYVNGTGVVSEANKILTDLRQNDLI